MPRSHPLQNQWRILVAAFAVVLILCTGFQTDAQQKKRRNRPAQKPAQTGQNSNSTATTGAQQQPTKKNLAALRGSDGPNGGRATITSDAPLNDYEAYRSGNRYYVVIPQANAPGVPGNMSGRGFDDVQVHKRGNDTVLSFRLKPGTTARVQQKFNKLDVVFNSPADSSSGTQSGASTNGSTAGTASATTGTGSAANTSRTGTEGASGTAKPPDATTNTGASAGAPSPTPGATPSSANTNAAATPPTDAASPGSTSLPSITPGLGIPGETPSVAASPTPPADQLAQAQPAPSVPSAITTTPVASGTSLGAVLKSNWLLILIAALILISIGLVAMTRSRRGAAAAAAARPAGDSETTPAPALEEGAAATLESVRFDTATAPEAMPLADMAGLPAGMVLADVADETETVEAEPLEALDVERVRLEIKHVLTGQEYDESVINATSRDARQLIESELLFALSRRNTERRDRALKAFTEHGYFDDATRDLRTAAVPAERAAAARKLGLTRDTASTPHLVAALEDTAPEVRRAAIEALTELQDQSAVAPLESLLEREEDRKVPHALIRRAIRASASGPAQQEEKAESTATGVAAAVEAAPVHETAVEEVPVEAAPVEVEPVSAQEAASPVAVNADSAAEAASTVEEPPVEAPVSLALTDEQTRTIEAEPAAVRDVDAATAEAATDLPAEAIAIVPALVAGIASAEADAAERSRAEADAARIHAEQESRRRTEEERQRAEEEALQRRVQEAARLRAEADERRRAEETRRREEEQRRRQAEEEQRRADERRAEEERLREEEQRRVEAERRRAEEEEQRRLEEEHRRVEEERRREEERLRVEEEERIQAEQRQRAEEERLRLEADAARQREEAEAERQRVEAEARQREEAERLRAEEEARRLAEEEESALRRAAEEEQAVTEGRAVTEEQPPVHALVESADAEEAPRLNAFEEERVRAEEARRQRVEERERRRAEEERARIQGEGRERAEADAARRRAEDAALRLAEMRRRVEEEARQREEAERLRAEEEARRLAEEEESARRRAAEEEEAAAARQREEEEASARQRAEEERLLRAEEELARTEEQSRLHAEEERKRVEEEARQREEAEAARIQFERERAEQQQPSLLQNTDVVEATPIEAEEIEPAQAETASTLVQSDLFEATFTPQTPFASRAETAEDTAGTDATGWIEVDFEEREAGLDEQPSASAAAVVADEAAITEYADVEAAPVREVEEYSADASVKEIDVAVTERGIALADEDFNSVPGSILRRLGSEVASDRAAAVSDLARVGGDDAFREISAAFDDPAQLVRDAAARALFGLSDDHAASFTRALREAPPERRRRIGNALANSGLAGEAIGHLMGESREKTYDAFSLLFLMSKAGEVQPLMRAIEEHPNSEVRLAVVKLLALSGQQDILPAFRRLAVRGSLPTEVRSAVMEAIYQISSQTSTDTTHVA